MALNWLLTLPTQTRVKSHYSSMRRAKSRDESQVEVTCNSLRPGYRLRDGGDRVVWRSRQCYKTQFKGVPYDGDKRQRLHRDYRADNQRIICNSECGCRIDHRKKK